MECLACPPWEVSWGVLNLTAASWGDCDHPIPQIKEQRAQVLHCFIEQFIHLIAHSSRSPVGPLCAVAGQLGGHQHGRGGDDKIMTLLICVRFTLVPTSDFTQWPQKGDAFILTSFQLMTVSALRVFPCQNLAPAEASFPFLSFPSFPFLSFPSLPFPSLPFPSSLSSF